MVSGDDLYRARAESVSRKEAMCSRMSELSMGNLLSSTLSTSSFLILRRDLWDLHKRPFLLFEWSIFL